MKFVTIFAIVVLALFAFVPASAGKYYVFDWKTNKQNILINMVIYFQKKHTCELYHTDNQGGIECLVSMPRFLYNVKSGKCEEVIYGGCAATTKNFSPNEVCEKVCGGYKQE